MVLLVKMKEGSTKLCVQTSMSLGGDSMIICRVICIVEKVGYGDLEFLSLTDYYCSLVETRSSKMCLILGRCESVGDTYRSTTCAD